MFSGVQRIPVRCLKNMRLGNRITQNQSLESLFLVKILYNYNSVKNQLELKTVPQIKLSEGIYTHI